MDTYILRQSASAIVGIVFFSIIFLFKKNGITSRQSFFMLVVWTLISTCEFWIFGPSSFVPYYDESDSFIPSILAYLAATPATFSPALNGGNDIILALPAGSEFVSLSAALFKAFPVWLAVALSKVAGVALATSGMYLVARRMAQADRGVALGLAAAMSLAHNYLIVSSLIHGFGFALIPWAVLIVVGLAEHRRYWLFVIMFGMFHAIACSVTHSSMALLATMVCAAILVGTRHWVRVIMACGFIALMAIVNWSDFLWAFTLLGKTSARAMQEEIRPNFWTALAGIPLLLQDKFGIAGVPLILASLCLGWMTRAQWRWRFIVVLTLLFAPMLLISDIFPPAISILVAKIRPHYLAYGYYILVALFFAHATSSQGNQRVLTPRQLRFVVAACGGVALALSADYKVFNLVNWLGFGSAATMTSIENLRDRNWAATTPFRVASIPFRFNPGFASLYGLEAVDGYVNLLPVEWARYWQEVTHVSGKASVWRTNELYLADRAEVDFRGAARFDIDTLVNTRLLTKANTRYILSYVPLDGEGLHKVSGPPEAADIRRALPFRAKIAADFHSMLHPADMHVYELAEVWPRVFAADQLVTIADAVSPKDFYARLADAPLGEVLVRNAERSQLPAQTSKVTLSDIRVHGDGVQVVATTQSQGVVVFNYKMLPFWQGSVDGQAVPLVSVDGIHCAIVVPAGTHQVQLSYRRPQVAEILKQRL